MKPLANKLIPNTRIFLIADASSEELRTRLEVLHRKYKAEIEASRQQPRKQKKKRKRKVLQGALSTTLGTTVIIADSQFPPLFAFSYGLQKKTGIVLGTESDLQSIVTRSLAKFIQENWARSWVAILRQTSVKKFEFSPTIRPYHSMRAS